MSLPSCPVELRLVQDRDVVGGPFENTKQLEWMQNLPPRFGKSDEITDFIQRRGVLLWSNLTPISSSTIQHASLQQANAAGKDYAIGVLGLPVAIGGFFLLWLLMLFGCCIAGPRRVGIFSGRRVLPPLPIPTGKEVQEEEDEMLAEAMEQSRRIQIEAQQQHELEVQWQMKEQSQGRSTATSEKRLYQRQVSKDETLASMKDISDDDDSYYGRLPTTNLLGKLEDEAKAESYYDRSPYAAYYNTYDSQNPQTPERQIVGKDVSPRYENYRINLSSKIIENYREDSDELKTGKEKSKKAAIYNLKSPSTPTTPNTDSTSGSTGTDSTPSPNRGPQSRPFLPASFSPEGSSGLRSAPSRALSLSHYESEAVARKRVIEEYVRSRSTKSQFHDFWAPEEYARVINSPPSLEEQKLPEGEDTHIGQRIAAKETQSQSRPVLPRRDDERSPQLTSTGNGNNTNKQLTRHVHFEEDDEQALANWHSSIERSDKAVAKMHIMIIVASFSAVVAALLYSIGGMEVLLTSIKDGRDSLNEMQLKMQELVDLFGEISEQQELARNVSTTLLEQVNADYCPLLASSSDGLLCSNITDADNCTGLSPDVPNFSETKDVLEQFAGGLATLDILFPSNVEPQIEQDLVGLQAWIARLEAYLDYAPWILWSATACTDLLAVLCLLILWDVILTYTRRKVPKAFMCLRTRIVMPLFVLLLIIEAIVGVAWVMTSIISADFCIDSPDSRMQLLLEQNQAREFEVLSNQDGIAQSASPSIVYSLANYYVSGCPASEFPSVFDDRVGLLASSFAPVSRFETVLSNTDQSALEATCGTVELDGIRASVSIARLVLCLLTQSLVRLI